MVDVVEVLERLGSDACWGEAPSDVVRDTELAQLDAPARDALIRAAADGLLQLQNQDVEPFQIMVFPAEEEDEDEADEDAPVHDTPPSE